MTVRQAVGIVAVVGLLCGCVQFSPPGLERNAREAVHVVLASEGSGSFGEELCIVDEVPISIIRGDREISAMTMQLAARDLARYQRLARPPMKDAAIALPSGCSEALSLSVDYQASDELYVTRRRVCPALCGYEATSTLIRSARGWSVRADQLHFVE